MKMSQLSFKSTENTNVGLEPLQDHKSHILSIYYLLCKPIAIGLTRNAYRNFNLIEGVKEIGHMTYIFLMPNKLF